jgi:predicted nuclease with RNAse H fold
MGFFVGLDPGGKKKFGWCALVGDRVPLQVLRRGVARHAEEAVKAVLDAAGSNAVTAAGIDAPLFWQPTGDRSVDRLIRDKIQTLRANTSTVQAVNSLCGACLVQGMMAAMLLRARIALLPITETHPKALLWLLGCAQRGKPAKEVTLANLREWIGGDVTNATEHERDAALSACAAFAMTKARPDWRNLYLEEKGAITPLDPPPGYWLPIPA